MTIFIPEWTRISGRNLHIKRVLNTLDDACVVRRPIRCSTGAPELFVQHPANGWLAITVSEVQFPTLDPGQLFESEGRADFEQCLAEFRAIDEGLGLLQNRLEKLLLMWSCSSDETRRLSSHYLPRFGIRLLSKEQAVNSFRACWLRWERMAPNRCSDISSQKQRFLWYAPPGEVSLATIRPSWVAFFSISSRNGRSSSIWKHHRSRLIRCEIFPFAWSMAWRAAARR